MMFSLGIKLILILLTLSFGFSPKAYAYLDPGSGSYIIQMIIAGVVAGFFAIKMFFSQIKSFFLGLFGKKPSPPNDKPK